MSIWSRAGARCNGWATADNCRARSTPRRRALKHKPPFKKTLERLRALRQDHPDKRVWLCFEDEARFGLKPTYRRFHAPIGQRPTAPSCIKYEWSYVFAAVHPESGFTHSLILPTANLQTMQLYLGDFAATLPKGVIALLVLDGATWLPQSCVCRISFALASYRPTPQNSTRQSTSGRFYLKSRLTRLSPLLTRSKAA